MKFLIYVLIMISECFETVQDMNKKVFGEVTLVSAFFDVGRENFRKLPRSKNTYFDYFKRWARVKNPLIVFCETNTVREEILSIRKMYFLENKTVVKVIEDVYSIEKELYERLVEVSRDPFFLNFRLKRGIVENNAKYDYIQIFKSYFLYEASLTQNIETDSVVWIDLGFDHGGKLYPFEEDWSLRLECEISEKVMLFRLPHKLDKRPLFEIVRTVHPDTLTGGFFICPKNLVESLWLLVRECIYNLLWVGLMDDDQPVLLLASRQKPDLFEIRRSYWFFGLKQACQTEFLRINEKYLVHMK